MEDNKEMWKNIYPWIKEDPSEETSDEEQATVRLVRGKSNYRGGFKQNKSQPKCAIC